MERVKQQNGKILFAHNLMAVILLMSALLISILAQNYLDSRSHPLGNGEEKGIAVYQ